MKPSPSLEIQFKSFKSAKMEALGLRSHSPSMDLPWNGSGSIRQTKYGYSPDFSQRSASKRGLHMYNVVAAKNFISRSVRARRRRAFLNTYTLSSLDNSSPVPQPKCDKLKRVGSKIKSALVSSIKAVRNSSVRFRGCTSRSAICPSSAIQSD